MTNKLSLTLQTALIVAFLAIGIAGAAWSGPGGNPPTGNAPAPINVGPTAQIKDGGLTLGNSSVETALYTKNGNVGFGILPSASEVARLVVDGQVKITGGTPGTDKLLVSDASGLASWKLASDIPGIGTGSGGGGAAVLGGSYRVEGAPTFYGIMGSTGNIAGNSTDINRSVPMPVNGTLQNLYVRQGFTNNLTAYNGGTLWTFEIYKNGSPTGLKTTLSGTNTVGQANSNTSNSVSVSKGDTLSLAVTHNGSPFPPPSLDLHMTVGYSGSGTGGGGGGGVWTKVAETSGNVTTSVNMPSNCKSSVCEGLIISKPILPTNNPKGATFTYRQISDNSFVSLYSTAPNPGTGFGVNGNNTESVIARDETSTGQRCILYDDHTSTETSTERWSLSGHHSQNCELWMQSGSGGGGLTPPGSGGGGSIISGGFMHQGNINIDYSGFFLYPIGLDSYQNYEQNVQMPVSSSGTLSNVNVYIFRNEGLDAGSPSKEVTFYVRKNGSNQISKTFKVGDSGFISIPGSFSVEKGDLISLKLARTSGPTGGAAWLGINWTFEIN